MKILIFLAAIIFQLGAEVGPEDQVRGRTSFPVKKDTSEINAKLNSLTQEKARLEKSGNTDPTRLQLLDAQISFLTAIKSGAMQGLTDSSLNRLKSQIELFKSFHGNPSISDLSQLNALGDQMSQLRSLSHRESSELSLNKTFKGESIETTKKFTISPENKMVYLEIGGKVNSGLISIIVTKPNGVKFKTIEIDATSDVNFDQRIDLEKDKSGNIGDWSLVIKAIKAHGNYYVSIITR